MCSIWMFDHLLYPRYVGRSVETYWGLIMPLANQGKPIHHRKLKLYKRQLNFIMTNKALFVPPPPPNGYILPNLYYLLVV